MSDDEGVGTPENFEKVEMDDVLEAEQDAAGAAEHVEEFHHHHVEESSDHHVVPDAEQLIDFEDHDEERDLAGPLLYSEQLEGSPADDDADVDLPLPPPPPPAEQHGQDLQ